MVAPAGTEAVEATRRPAYEPERESVKGEAVMQQDNLKLTSRAALLASIAACFPVVAHGAPVARVDFAIGNVTAIGPNGQSRQVGKGTPIDEGEMIATNNGRAQLRFTDGAQVSLQPQSEFRIDQYKYEGKTDGSEKGFFSLLKGGLRTITGLVGRNNKQNYQVSTTVATIGIRGTEYTIQYGNSIEGTVGEGEIEVCNGAGCLNVTNGESYYVQDQDVKPQLSNKGTDLPPAPPENPPSDFRQGETVDQSGTPCDLGGGCGNLLTVTGKVNAAWLFYGSRENTQAVVNNGRLERADLFPGFPATFFGPYRDVGGDSIIAWGAAADCSGGECGGLTHYAVGLPVDNIGTLAGLEASYSLLGATPITNSSGTNIGTLNSATMVVSFLGGSSSGSLNMNMTLPFVGNFTALNDVSGGGSTFSFNNFFASQSVNVYGDGFFAGNNAARAGFVYQVYDFSNISGQGAAGMKQNSLGPSELILIDLGGL
jgi:hypothetical protein